MGSKKADNDRPPDGETPRGRLSRRAALLGSLAACGFGAAYGITRYASRGRRDGIEPREREFHQQFGFRPRDQHRGRDLEIEGPERALAEQVGDRHAARARREQFLERFTLGHRRQVLGPRVEPCARPAEHLREQALGLAARFFAFELRGSLGQQGAHVVQGATSGGSTTGTSTRGRATLRQ